MTKSRLDDVKDRIKYIEEGKFITMEWIKEQKEVLKEYREFLPDIRQASLEITDPTFRHWCNVAEALFVDVLSSETLNINLYLRLNRAFVALVSSGEDVELSEAFEGINM